MGGFGELAQRIGVSRSAPSMWKARGTTPAEYCAAIERATAGAVTRADLRPDDYWQIWPDLPAPEPQEARDDEARRTRAIARLESLLPDVVQQLAALKQGGAR